MSVEAPYVTRKEAAERLDVSVRTLDRLCLEGALVKVPYGGQVRICAASLDAYLEARQAPAAASQRARDAFEAAFPLPWLDERKRLTRAKREEKARARREAEHNEREQGGAGEEALGDDFRRARSMTVEVAA